MDERLIPFISNQTPIEILLQVDEDGTVSAKKVYCFLDLNLAHYAKWCKNKIEENEYAEENIDYKVFTPKCENSKGGRPTIDYKLSVAFAKKLCMLQKNERGEQARNYFIKVEEKLKDAIQLQPPYDTTKAIGMSGVANAAKVAVSVMDRQGSSANAIARQVELMFKQFGIKTIPDFVYQSPYEQLSIPVGGALS